jgi:fibronectin-binding autotransporter adhesin
MWKTLLSRVGSCLLLITSVATADAQLTSLTEGFDTTGNSVPTPTGIFAQSQPWINVNNSDVPNTTGFNWEKGDSGTFIWTAQSPVGSATSFAQVSFNSSTGTVVSDWLLTPVLTLEAGATFSFYTVAAKGTTFANDLQVYISTSGSSTNVGSDAQTPTGGVFTLLPGGDLNPTLAVNGYPLTQPNGWTLETFTLTSSEVSTPTSGRIGLRYFIPNTATQGSEVGIDTFSFAAPTIFTRTVTGDWSDSTGWTPTGVPNGNSNIADLILPASGITQTVNLQGGTFTVNQLNVTGTGAGAWTVSNGTLVFDGATPTFTNQSTATGITATLGVNLQLNANTTFSTQNAGAITALNGTISGVGNVIITGLGTFLVNTAQNYSTETIINQGTFEAGAADVFSASSAVILSASGTLNLGNANQTIASLAGTGGQVVLGTSSASPATLTVGGDNTPTIYAGSISGFGGLNKVGTGTLTLTGSTTYTGTTTVSAGTIAGGVLNSLSPNSAFSIANGATLDISAASQVIGSLAGVTGSNVNLGAKTLTIGGDNTSTTFSGLISGTGSLIKNGAATFTILGTDNYSGGTTIGGGTLQLGNGATNGSISGNVNDNGTLTFDENGPVTFTGVISGAGNLVQRVIAR